MADASTFGGQLDAGTSFGASFGGAGDASAGPSVGADVPSIPDQPTQSAPQAAQEPSFGASLRNMLPGPHYTPPDPAASPADQQADAITQRINRGNQVINNPLAQLFMGPEGIAAARDKVQGLTQQLQSAKQQQQQQADIQKQATNFGVPKSAQNPMMTGDTIDNYLLDQYKSGDFTAANALKARGKGDWVQDFAGAALDGAGTKLKAADAAATKLSAANGNQAAYNAAVKSLTPEDRQALTDMGMPNIPEKASGADGWQGIVEKHGATFAQAQQLHAQTVQKLNNMTNFDQSAPKEVGESIAANVTLGNTNEPAFDGKNVKIRTMDGQPGVVGSNGSVHTDKFGLAPSKGGWNTTTPERLEKNDKMLAGDDVKGAINQYNIANKFRHEALNDKNYASAAGIALLKDTLGGVGRDVAEKSAAAGTTGLSQMFSNQQGGFEGFMNRAQQEYAAFETWRSKGEKGPMPRMSAQTIAGLKSVAQLNYDFANEQAGGRLSGAMRYAGLIGRPLEDIPLDEDLKKSVQRYHEEGRVEAINGYNAHPSLVTGNQRVFFPQGSNVQGASPPRPPVPAAQDQQPVPPSSPGGGTPPAATAPQGSQAPAAPGPAGGAAPNNDGVYKAIFAQESGGGRNTATSVTGARGGMQIQPGTWAQYAKPGEKIDNPADNQAVGRRIIDDLSQKSGGDPARIAVGYFSGPGNIAPPGSPTPWKVDRADPTGKKVSAYVTDIVRRMAPKLGEPGAPSPPISGPNIAGQTGAGSFTTGRKDQPDETDIVQKGIENAPTIGGIAGSAAGPGGGFAGGAAGQALRNYMRGETVLQPNVVGSGAFGAAGGIATGGLKGAALRAGTAAAGGGVEGGLEGGAAGAVEGTLKGAVGALAGEAGARGVAAVANTAERFGGFLGMGGHQTFSRLTPEAQEAYLDAAKTVAGGKPEKPAALPGGGKNVAAETAFEEKLADYEDAEHHLKSVLPHVKPEEAAYAAQQVHGEPATKGEALTGRPLAAEKANVARGYDELRSDVAQRGDELGITKVKPSGVLPDGPVSNLRTADNPSGKISDTYAKEMHDAEMLASAPAPNAETRWGNLQKARAELLEHERTALAGPSPDTNRAKAMRAGADALRPEIQRTFEALFGKEGAKTAMQRLDTLDTRYARVMKLSGDGDIAGSIAKGGKAGRDTSQAYKALTMGDISAQRVMNALVSLRKGVPWQEISLMVPVIAGELGTGHVGLVSGPLATAKLTQLLRDYMIKRGAGQPVKMDTLLQKQRAPAVNPAIGGRAGAVAGSEQAAASPPISY